VLTPIAFRVDRDDEANQGGDLLLAELRRHGPVGLMPQPVGAPQALAPDHVVCAGTASKSLAPALRLGWLVVPPRLLDAVQAVSRAAGLIARSAIASSRPACG
jgi:DNA-binding transcriptional MocR family regulator